MTIPLREARPILIVDFDAHVRDVLRDAYPLEGYPVLTGGSGVEAAHLPRTVQPALIVLDRNRGDCRGETLASHLRALPDQGSHRRADRRARRAQSSDWRVRRGGLPAEAGAVNDLLAIALALAPSPSSGDIASPPVVPAAKSASTAKG